MSDESCGRPDEIVRGPTELNRGRLTVLCQVPRQGKTQAINMALSHASAEIVVFADANSIYASGAIRLLVRSFADPSAGTCPAT